ncbi:hypothetical protein CFC21_075124 [Triticum aestivum]|uniref:Cytochrome P450 n=2 Tax=Triticum aestivum TaxID=4565 RepID=A0A9R1KX01_WHEAT|nr:cytochrome P450 87A3-like [Triticum aestivum]KAF7069502.1 hypothetical protein CFC21_075124 [Triticum aestivum]
MHLEMDISVAQYVALCGVTLVIGWLVHWVYKWINPVCNGVLPPGSMGFPIIGETLDFLKASSSLDIPDFYKQRMKRYGPVFKTSLLGQPAVISTDAEVNRFVFQHEETLFSIGYPWAVTKIFGEKSIEAAHGTIHKFVRRCAFALFGLQNLKEVLLPEMEGAVRERLAAWATKPSVDVRGDAPDILFELVTRKCLGFDSSTKSGKLRNKFDALFSGLFSFPIYFPGTTFYRCMQARKNVQKTVRDTLAERLGTPGKKHGDLLDVIVEELQGEEPLISEDFAIDMVSMLLFSSVFTLSGTIAVAFKSLHDNPDVLRSLEKENQTMLKDRKGGCSGLTWEEYKSLTFTNQVTNEIIRISNAVVGVFRKTLTDVQVNGYTIPAGWQVIVNPMAVHLNEELFEDPLKFNPWRWMDESKRSAMLKNFLPFGAGIRVCPAADFVKLFVTLTLHILVTEYRWEEMKGTDEFRSADVMFPQGYHIRLRPKDDQMN